MIFHRICERTTCASQFVTLVTSIFMTASIASATELHNFKPVMTETPLAESTGNPSPFKSSLERRTYIIEFEATPVALFKGNEHFSATAPDASVDKKLALQANHTKRYVASLEAQHRQVMESIQLTLARQIKPQIEYYHAFNGVAVRIDSNEAAIIKTLSGVKRIEESIEFDLLTDQGPAWIGAPSIWQGDNSFGESMGEGAVIAILDTGINSDHPSFADVADDGYNHENPLGSGNYVPGSHCDVVDPSFCNDKLIGAWNLVNSVGDPTSPEDSDGHGSHTASTAAGNVIYAARASAATAEFTADISGVAPRANIIAYDVCISRCPSYALLAAIEQAVIDDANIPGGIHALNYSISGGYFAYGDFIETAFLSATAVGIYVAASAGNSGPGQYSTNHNSPWVSTTAAMTHNRRIDNHLTDLSSDNGTLPDITGTGFTDGVGPLPIVYAGDYPTANGSQNDVQPEQCLAPFPPGHFSGKIVVCDRGTIARVDKGANVLAGDAEGLVLANEASNGDSTSFDGHFLPAVHIGYSDGVSLKDWLSNVTTPMASISGYEVSRKRSNGDIMASFSSRGPNWSADIVKPDIGGPGVGILAAINNQDGGAGEFDFYSGTSMSSPHNAGSGALLSVLTGWTPYQIKSALMMTAQHNKMYKEDGITPTDPFDVGAGRIRLDRALKSGLLLNETPENFAAADPALGGAPSSLNIASMQNSFCFSSCSWERTFTNYHSKSATWRINGKASGLTLNISPKEITLAPGESATVTVTAEVANASPGWHFAELKLEPMAANLVDLRLPVAVKKVDTTSLVLTKHVDKPVAKEGESLTYTIEFSYPWQIGGPLHLVDYMPDGVAIDTQSISTTIKNGVENSPISVTDSTVEWEVELLPQDMNIALINSGIGYLPMKNFGIPPRPSEIPTCDNGGWLVWLPRPFNYMGDYYSNIIWSANGTVEMGTQSGYATPPTPEELPNQSAINNLLAPFWTDLNLCESGNRYIAASNDGRLLVLEFENVAIKNSGGQTVSFQVWFDYASHDIWFAYGDVSHIPGELVVGVEDKTGTKGHSYYAYGNGAAPQSWQDLGVIKIAPGSAELTFDATITRCRNKHDNVKVNEAELNYSGFTEKASARTECTKQ